MGSRWSRVGGCFRALIAGLALAMVLIAGEGSAAAADQQNAAPVRPPRAAEPPRIDGKLEDPAWREAARISGFIQRTPVEGAASSEETIVLLTYDAGSLYVGLRAFDSRPQSIAASVMRRDNFDIVQNDQFVIAIDSFNDGRNGYWFSTNPLGVRVDAQFFEEGEIWVSEWDGDWDCTSLIDGEGWTSEMRIPFSTLRFREGEEVSMGINLFRRIVRTSEETFSPRIPLSLPYGTPNVSAARKFTFSGIRPGRRLWVKPYVLGGGLRRFEPSSERDGTTDAGGEITFGITRSLTAVATFHTDFAFTDVDDRQIDLSRFDLFFPEKRDFFLDNAGLFAFGIPGESDLFFSRRIGIVRDGLGRALQAPLDHGARLTGRAGNAEVGFLDVRTGATEVTPDENFTVGRVKYGVGRRSYVGAIAMGRHSGRSRDHFAAGADGALILDNQVGFSGFVAHTGNSGGGDGSRGLGWNLSAFRRGEETSFLLGYSEYTEGFRPEMGFLRQADIRRLEGEFRIPWYAEGGRLWRVVPETRALHVVRHEGGIDTWSLRQTGVVEARSLDALEIFVERRFEAIADAFEIFRDVEIPPGDYDMWRGGLVARSNLGRRIGGRVLAESGGFFGGRSVSLGAGGQWKTSRRLTTALDRTLTRVDLPSEAFDAVTWQWRTDFSLDTSLSSSAIVQYDNASRDLGINLRASYLFREGTELSVLYTQTRGDLQGGTMSGEGRGTLDRAVLLKLTYLFGL